MEALSLIGNQAANSQGQDIGRIFLGNVVNATVVEKKEDNHYVLSVGRQIFEAKVVADLVVGQRYQMVVDKAGVPPELSLLNREGEQKKSPDGLSAEEERWLGSFLKSAGRSRDEINGRELLALVRSLGYDIDQDPAEVFTKLKNILGLIEKIDAANPELRQALGQTLLRNLDAFVTLKAGADEISQQVVENIIKLSGVIPKWNEGDLQVLVRLLQSMGTLSPQEQRALQMLFLGLSGEAGAEQKLQALLEAMLLKLKDIPTLQGEGVQDRARTLARSILSDPNSRLLLASDVFRGKLEESQLPGQVDRRTAIASYLRQAPGLNTPAISSMLEQFSVLGGRLDKLPVNDVLAAQDLFRGATPQSLQVHRAGTLLYFSQTLPESSRSFHRSALAGVDEPGKLPVLLSRRATLDPASTSASLAKMKEFSSGGVSLNRTLFVDRLVQVWVGEGRAIADLRPQLNSIQAWNAFLESHPGNKAQLVDHLFREPTFASAATAKAEPGKSAEVLPQTRLAFEKGLAESGSSVKQFPAKAVESALQALQTAAGPTQAPTREMVQTAAWLLSRGFEVTPQMLSSLSAFQRGHSTTVEFMQALTQLRELIPGLPQNLKDSLGKAWHELNSGGSALKDVVSFYQRGDGSGLRDMVSKLHDYYLAYPGKHSATILATLQAITNHMGRQEAYLEGLKQYNVQAQRSDTPLAFEIPVSFGETMEQAWLRIFKRYQGSGAAKEDEASYKIVIDLRLEALGHVRSELTSHKGRMQLDFLTPKSESLEKLKEHATHLSEMLDAHNLKSSLKFRLKDVAEADGLTPLAQHSLNINPNRHSIDLSA